LQLLDLPIKCRNPRCSQVMRACAIETCVEFEQFLNFRQRETCVLRSTNESQPPNVVVAVATDTVAPWRGLEQPFALVETDSFDANPARFCELSN
jgi:hypothetical protein